jgi:hypothetical protein
MKCALSDLRYSALLKPTRRSLPSRATREAHWQSQHVDAVLQQRARKGR